MQMNFYSSLFIFISVCTCNISWGRELQARYNGYKVYRLTALQENHIKAIMLLKDQGIMYWGLPSLKIGGTTDILVAPHLQGSLIQGLKEVGMKVVLLHSDVQRIIDEQAPKKKTSDGPLEWDTYSRLADIYSFMEWTSTSQVFRSSGAQSETFSLGKSYEGRNIMGIKIFVPNNSTRGKPAIWLDSNIHSREWITSAVSTFLINQLLSEDPVVSQWAKEFDWYIVPVVNPDGFEYSHTHNRLWRKNRSSTNSSLGCRGVDLNRNFGFHWNETGSSNNPCSGHYAGSSAFSEPESAAISKTINSLIKKKKVDLQMYLSLHSFSQMILLPYAFNNIRIPQYNTYMRIAKVAAAAHAEKYGTVFTYGTIIDLLYSASGCSTDWVKGIHNVPLALTYELRDRGLYASLLPPEEIIPSALEFIDGLAVYIQELKLGIPSVDPPHLTH